MMKHFETGGDPKFLLKSRGLNLFQENVYIYESYICHEWNDHTLHSFSVFFLFHRLSSQKFNSYCILRPGTVASCK